MNTIYCLPIDLFFFLFWISLTEYKTILILKRLMPFESFPSTLCNAFNQLVYFPPFLNLFEGKSGHSSLRGSEPLLPRNLNNPLLVLRPQISIVFSLNRSSHIISIFCLISIAAARPRSLRKFIFDSHLSPHRKELIFHSKVLAPMILNDLHSIFLLPWILNLRLLFCTFYETWPEHCCSSSPAGNVWFLHIFFRYCDLKDPRILCLLPTLKFRLSFYK